MRKFHDAKVQNAPFATVWGSGTPRREFLHVDDLADACLFLMEHYDGDEHINVGTGEDLSIRELAEMIRDIVAPGVDIRFDAIEAGWHAAQAARREPPARARDGATASRFRPASPPPTSGSASARR